ncbi:MULTISPECIES: efflux RND transporter periplasmic adaptor subunit [Silvimonas]|uniref:efflux RND transporter periplasmic adaptor subunit n=1 Tax=Silvimonas TaxID=300264 RepID=UPI0024B32E22|nr:MULTISPECIES: efflux RND transporter periplasmic adaptor subunit [Silvimonas]MDR3426653.1 efflux RND transporter periplasmic adaptor subunit [Silvimonas sp.]
MSSGRALPLAVPLAVSLTLAFALSACDKKAEAPKQPPPKVTVLQLQPRTLETTYETVGQTAGYRQIQVRARVEGILLKRDYTEGKPVKAGQLMFQIDPATYKATLDQALGVEAQTKAALDKATADRDRIIPLYKENAVSRKDYDDAMAAYDSAKANLDSSKAKSEEARINLGYTNVVAPIGGMASKINFSEGSLVSPATSNGGLLTTIDQLDPLYANFSISETDKLALQQAEKRGDVVLPQNQRYPVKLRLSDGTLYDHSGLIDFADSKVDPTTGTISGRAIIPNPSGTLLPGQFVRVLIGGIMRKNAILIPQRAVVQIQADKAVLVVNDKNVVESRVVQLGNAYGTDFIVASGLKGNERIVVEGVLKARPGSPVEPVDASAVAAADAPAAAAVSNASTDK